LRSCGDGELVITSAPQGGLNRFADTGSPGLQSRGGRSRPLQHPGSHCASAVQRRSSADGHRVREPSPAYIAVPAPQSGYVQRRLERTHPGTARWESFYRDRWQHDKVMRRSSPLARACSRRNDRARVVASVTDVPVTQTPPMHVTARVCGGSKRDRGARGTDCAGRRIAT